jgi:hypothetical protein
VWVSIPETHDDVPFRSATLQIGLQDDPNHFHSNLRLETIAPEAVVVGGIEDHPAKAPKGFRGVVFCIGDASLKKARLTLDFYDSESPASRRLRLNIAAADQQQLGSIDLGCHLAAYFCAGSGPVSTVAGR